jgi:hypothetical protein
MAEQEWYRRTATRWIRFRSVPIKRLWVLIAAVFLLFSVFGFYVDLMYRGVLPYVVVLQIALYVGLNASLWIIVLSRLSMPFLLGLIVLQFFNTLINTSLANWMTRSFDLKPVPSELGIHFAATATMSAIIQSRFSSSIMPRCPCRNDCRGGWRSAKPWNHSKPHGIDSQAGQKARLGREVAVRKDGQCAGGVRGWIPAVNNRNAIPSVRQSLFRGHGLRLFERTILHAVASLTPFPLESINDPRRGLIRMTLKNRRRRKRLVVVKRG